MPADGLRPTVVEVATCEAAEQRQRLLAGQLVPELFDTVCRVIESVLPEKVYHLPIEPNGAVLSAATCAAALLQRAVPEGGAGLVAEEGAGELPDHGGR